MGCNYNVGDYVRIKAGSHWIMKEYYKEPLTLKEEQVGIIGKIEDNCFYYIKLNTGATVVTEQGGILRLESKLVPSFVTDLKNRARNSFASNMPRIPSNMMGKP